MKRYLCLIALIGICSCGKTEPAESPEPEPEEQPENTSANYTFAGIEYSAEKDGFAEYITEEDIPFTFMNGSSAEQTFVFRPENNIMERSGFWSGDTRAFAFVGEGQKVKIPASMSDGGVLALDDGTRWDYSKDDQRLRPVVPDSGTEIKIPANHKMTLVPTYTLLALSANYALNLKGVEFGETVTVEGQWWGVFYVGYSLDYTVEPI